MIDHITPSSLHFNYRVAVLWDGVRSAIPIGRSRKAEKYFLTEPNISWGHQVTVMFQISTLVIEMPAFAQIMQDIKGESPNTQLYSEPWGHMLHFDNDCSCLLSDRTALYVHGLSPMQGDAETGIADDQTSKQDKDNERVDIDCGYLGMGRPGSVPFDRALMAGCYWLFMCGGKPDCWCLLIGSGL